MTTNPTDDDQIIGDATRILDLRVNEARALLDHIDRSRREQPERLAKSRGEADEARGWSLIEEPWDDQVSTIPAFNEYGDEREGFTLPNFLAKELWGARMAFDVLDCGDDLDQIDQVRTRYFKMAHGDTGLMFLLTMSALSTIAQVVMPQLLEEIEDRASNYDIRVMIADARTKAWEGRVSEIRKMDDEARDIGTEAFDPNEPQ